MIRLQPLSAKLGEVRFRKKLVQQHLGKKELFSEEPDNKEILKILKQRVATSRKIFQNLIDQEFTLSPFLEIGAEKAHRSMLLVNEFKANGAASDISFESLASASKFAKLLNFEKKPILVCSDAYQLPFLDNSFPFVFCFETLHHFPNPAPIVKEIYRVLSPGGIFYFGEEPIKQDFQLSLWRRGYRLTRWEKILKLIGILPFLSRIGKAEVSQGILEEEFPLSIWREALDVFQTVNLEVKPVFFGPKSPLIKSSFCWSNLNLIVLILIALQGGGINGFAIKEGKDKHLKDPIRFLACPDCYKAITKTDKGFYCQGCQREFYNKDGVLMFLPWELHKKLYG